MARLLAGSGKMLRPAFLILAARVGFYLKVVAWLQTALVRHPCGHAAGAVAADLGDGTIGIMEPDTA